LAGPGVHVITYTWDNGLAAPNHCTQTKTITFTVTAPTVSYSWQSGSAPTAAQLSCSNNTNYGLKADNFATVGTYIQPGFIIGDGSGNISYSAITIKEGASGSFVSVYPQKILTYCVPSYQYQIKLSGTDFGVGSIVNITDNATGAILYSGVFSSGMTITLAPNTIKGSAVFSGPGVSNVKLGAASDYIGSGYGVFNPSVAGPGTHTLTYTWNNGYGCTGTATKTVTVSGLNAGTGTSKTVCENSATPITLFSLVTGGTAGGTWTRATGTGGTFVAATGTFTPAVGATTSTFTYTLGSGTCTSTATVTVNINPV